MYNPKDYTTEIVIALSYPKQKSIEEKLKNSIKDYPDNKNILHVPKKFI